MKNGIFQHLTPWEKLALFIALCFLSSLLFGLLGISLAQPLFGVDASNTDLLTDLGQKDSIRTVKMLNFFFHLGAFILPAIIFSKIVAYDPNDYLFTKKLPKLNLLLWVFLLVISTAIMNDWLAALNSKMDLSFLSEDFQNEITYNQSIRDKSIFAYVGSTWKSFGLNLFLLAIVPAIGEEFVFRGVLQNLFAKATKKMHLSIWVTAFLFAFIHFQFMDFLPRFFLGAIFGYVVVLTGNIWTAVIMHFLNNSLALFVLFGVRRGFIKETDWWVNLGIYHLVFALLIGVIAIYMLTKSSKWHEVKGIYFR